ncbi:hypothetical protein [Cohnella mopanensis]|uniref:hypothetical protein n=1 Tax=Cohnella mopanensis TaxID=2911966 RepID=UPI001EF7FE0A|nr:hypothetical protein [Cohnella mopanensis]
MVLAVRLPASRLFLLEPFNEIARARIAAHVGDRANRTLQIVHQFLFGMAYATLSDEVHRRHLGGFADLHKLVSKLIRLASSEFLHLVEGVPDLLQFKLGFASPSLNKW